MEKKKNLVRSLQITNTNVCKFKKTEGTVRTEENKVPSSHQLCHEDGMAGV